MVQKFLDGCIRMTRIQSAISPLLRRRINVDIPAYGLTAGQIVYLARSENTKDPKAELLGTQYYIVVWEMSRSRWNCPCGEFTYGRKGKNPHDPGICKHIGPIVEHCKNFLRDRPNTCLRNDYESKRTGMFLHAAMPMPAQQRPLHEILTRGTICVDVMVCGPVVHKIERAAPTVVEADREPKVPDAVRRAVLLNPPWSRGGVLSGKSGDGHV